MKNALKRVLKGALDTEVVQRALSTEVAKRHLGDTRLYPKWERDLRGQVARYPDWTDILEGERDQWEEARKAAAGGPRILLPVSAGCYAFESLLAVALTLRGARVHFLLCDRHLPACYIPQIREFPDPGEYARLGPTRRWCGDCFFPGERMLSDLGLPIHRHSEQVSEAEEAWARDLAAGMPVDEIADFRLDGVPVGEQVVANTLRYYTRGDLRDEPHAEAIQRRYLHAALLAERASDRLLSEHEFECLVAHHGLYVPHGIYIPVARRHGVRAVAYCTAYRKQTMVFSHGETYHHTMPAEPVENWEDMPWTPEMEKEILVYLKSRWHGTEDWISYLHNTVTDTDEIAAELGIDFSKPTVGLLTNIIWDAQLSFPDRAFPNMMDWLVRTLDYFRRRPELQLLMRVHPAETGSREKVLDELERREIALPSNVFVIPPEKLINTYAVMLKCDSVILYGTQTGVELASFGVPVIVAGEAWVKNKGITLDVWTDEEYFRLLDRLPLGERMSEERTRRARKYAYHYFLRRMIPVEFFKPPAVPLLMVEVSDIDELRPGRSVGLDVICDGILQGEEFIYPAERFSGSLATDSAPTPVAASG